MTQSTPQLGLSALPAVPAIPVASPITLPVLVTITAPADPADVERTPATVVVVLDRSGSMHGGRLAAAKRGLLRLIDRLDPRDGFGVVVFDDEVQVVRPVAPLTDKKAARADVRSIHEGGSTNLSGGLLAGVREGARADTGRATVILLSDGHANCGVTDHGALQDLAADAYVSGVAISTIGIGEGYDEDLLAAVARGGAGNSYFAATPDDVITALTEEVDGLLGVTASDVRLRVAPGAAVSAVDVLNDVTCTTRPEGITATVGDLYAEESRLLLVRVEVDAVPELGEVTVAEFEAVWTPPGSVREQSVPMPVRVAVVAAEDAAGVRQEPAVEAHLAHLHAQALRREAARAVRQRDYTAARTSSSAAAAAYAGLSGDARTSMGAMYDVEVADIDDWTAAVGRVDDSRLSKQNIARAYQSSGKPGRATRPSRQRDERPNDAGTNR